MSGLAEQLNELMNEFDQVDVHNEKVAKFIAECPDDKIEEMLKVANPYGPVLPIKTTDESMISVSCTNMRMEYAQRFAATAQIAFTNRMIKEYKMPEEVPAVEIEDYIQNPAILDTPPHITDERTVSKWKEARETMPERVAIWKFFQHIYQFDPDRHVAAALQTNKKDPSRKVPSTAATRRAVNSKKNAIRASVKRQDWEATEADLAPSDELSEVEKAAFGTIPPHDMFAKLNRYTEEHYEELQDATHNVYGVRPDIDFCLIVYDSHDTKEEARKFKDRHMESVISSITQIRKNRWAILGPYRENREKVDFLNRHTEVLKEMLDQRERDSHVATDIMKKRIKTKKAENVAEVGPDDKAFRRYIKANKPNIANMGGEYIGEEISDDDCPDDNVEVSVFTVGNGGREMKVHKIYNPVEAPPSQKEEVKE